MNLSSYESRGWEYHVTQYKKGSEKSKYILQKLNNIRIKLINDIFDKKYCKNMTGSKNLTSDYDLTLFLSNKDMKIYEKFINILDNLNIDLSKIFDVNIYLYELLCDKIYSPFKDIFYIRSISSLNCGINHLFIKCDKNIFQIQLNFVLLKFLESKIPLKLIHCEMINSKKLHKHLKSLLISDKNKERYKLQCHYSMMSNKLFNEINKKHVNDYNKIMIFIYYQCFARYYAIEGYYCFSTLYIVVYKLVLKTKLNLNKYDYILSIIENWLDLFNHIKIIKNISDIDLLDYSKYLYRIYYSWDKLKDLNFHSPKNFHLNEKLRKSKSLVKKRNDIENIHKYLDDIYYIYNIHSIKSLNNIKIEMMKQINHLLDNLIF